MIPSINFATHRSKKLIEKVLSIPPSVCRNHTSKNITTPCSNENHEGFETFENRIGRTGQATCNKCYRHWDSFVSQVTWFAIIGRETRKRQCHRAVLWACGLFAPSSRRMLQRWKNLFFACSALVSWCFSLRPRSSFQWITSFVTSTFTCFLIKTMRTLIT